MPAVKHLVLDVSVIIDLWLGLGLAEATESLFDLAAEGKTRLWVSASSIPTLDYVTRRALKQRGVPSEEVGHLVARLMEDLLQVASVLTNHGFEQKEIYRAAGDVEDAQIAAAARSLKGVPICVVSKDIRFDTLGEVPVKTPLEALTWMHREITDEYAKTIPFIDLTTQQASIRPDIEQGIERVLRHGKYILGPEVKELEERLAAYVGVKHGISCSSGTDALLIPLMAFGVGPGDAIFTTPFTFIATAEVIALLGATPVFVDIDPRTFNIDPDKLELVIRAVQANDPALSPLPKTTSGNADHNRLIPKGIIPVDLFGMPADYDRIMAVADRYKLFVLEDAAQSFGAEYRGRRAGSLGNVAATSFFPAKPLGCYGDGGAILTNDDDLAERMISIRVHGTGAVKYDNIRIGINGRMDTLQAAILLPKLEILPEEIRNRQRIAEAYTAALGGVSSLVPPVVPMGMMSAWSQYSVLAADETVREALQRELHASGIPTAVYYPKPLHMQAAFAQLGYRPEDFPISLDCSKRIFSLPMHPYLTAEKIAIITDAVRKAARSR